MAPCGMPEHGSTRHLSLKDVAHLAQPDCQVEQGSAEGAWYVDDIDQVVDELTAVGVTFARYNEFEHDATGITPRAGGGRIAWFQDPDGNTFAIEADA